MSIYPFADIDIDRGQSFCERQKLNQKLELNLENFSLFKAADQDETYVKGVFCLVMARFRLHHLFVRLKYESGKKEKLFSSVHRRPSFGTNGQQNEEEDLRTIISRTNEALGACFCLSQFGQQQERRTCGFGIFGGCCKMFNAYT